MSDPSDLAEAAGCNESVMQKLSALRALALHRPLTPRELVEKSRLIQTAPSGTKSDLEEAERALREALQLDEEYLPALVDLGYFYFAVEDRAEAARPLFERAVTLSRGFLTESASGFAGCLEELESEAEARRYLNEIARGGKALELESLLPDHQEWFAEGPDDSANSHEE